MNAGSDSLITVVIPAYNAEPFIEQAIDSVLSQTHDAIQLIVVDDGSTDRTASIGNSVGDARLTLVSRPNRGLSRARNTGLEMAKGAFVGFLDSDDYWLPKKLAVQLAAFAKDPTLVAVGALMHYESAEGRILGIAGQPVSPEEQNLIAGARLMPFPISSILFQRKVIADLGGFDKEIRGVEDLELLARVASVGRILCVPEVLGAYRIHGDSMSAQDLSLQRDATRFIRARLDERERGSDLSWDEFARTHRPTWRQSYGDRVQAWYRLAGLRTAERRWLGSIIYGSMAMLFGPRYTFRRLLRQRGRSPL